MVHQSSNQKTKGIAATKCLAKNNMNYIQAFKINSNAILPTRNKSTDAGLDLYALDDVFIKLGETRVVPTGIALGVPTGYVGKIEDRSSLGRKGLRVGGGVVDTGFSGEIGVILHNFSAAQERDSVLLQEGVRIRKGDKIAQVLLYKIETPEVLEVKELWSSERGSNGFGSSGR